MSWNLYKSSSPSYEELSLIYLFSNSNKTALDMNMIETTVKTNPNKKPTCSFVLFCKILSNLNRINIRNILAIFK